MILVKTMLVSCSSGFIGGSSSFIVSCYLVYLTFFLVWCMWPLAVSIDGVRCFLIRSIVKLVHVAKYPFLIAWLRVCLTVMNSVAWYYCARLGFFISTTKLFADWRVGVGIGCGVLDRCTCHIPATPLRFPYSINSPFFSTVIYLLVNVDVKTSSHSFPMDISAPDWR